MTTDSHPRRDPSTSSWFTPGRFALMLGTLIFLAFPEVIIGHRSFYFRDFGFFSYPLSYYQRGAFWSGELPLWNPLSNCGLPFLAQWNTMVFYPGALFYLLLPLSWSLAVFCLLHQFWGGLGMYYLARRWTGSQWAASMAGLVFAFNGLTLNCLMGHGHIVALGWLPWVILCVEHAWQTGGYHTPLAAMVAAIQMLGGGPEIVVFTWCIAGFVGMGQIINAPEGWHSRLIRGARLLLVFVLACGLAAVQILPFVDLVLQSDRSAGTAQAGWSMPPLGWANFLVPMFQGTTLSQGVFFQYEQAWTSSYYLGIGTVILAVWSGFRERRGAMPFLALVVVLGLVLALGPHSVVYRELQELVPDTGYMRYPIKFVVLVVAAAPLLAAQAIARLEAAGPASGAERLSLGLAGTAGLVTIALVAALAWSWTVPDDEWSLTRKSAMSRALFLIVMLGLLFAFIGMKARRGRGLLQLLFLLVVWLDLLTHAPWQNPLIPRAVYEPGLVQLTPKPEPGQARVWVPFRVFQEFLVKFAPSSLNDYVCKRLGLFTNANLLDDLPKVDGFFAMNLGPTERVLELLNTSPPGQTERLADFLGAAFVTANGELFKISARPTALPWITAGQAPVFLPENATLRALASPAFDPQRVVFLPRDAQAQVNVKENAKARVRLLFFKPEHVRFTVDTPVATLAVVAQSYYHWWRATVDGQPVRLWKANYAFQALAVPAGHHQIDLVYRDTGLVVGAAITGASLLICVGWFIASRRQRLKPSTICPSEE